MLVGTEDPGAYEVPVEVQEAQDGIPVVLVLVTLVVMVPITLMAHKVLVVRPVIMERTLLGIALAVVVLVVVQAPPGVMGPMGTLSLHRT
jgi:hypothetical protein